MRKLTKASREEGIAFCIHAIRTAYGFLSSSLSPSSSLPKTSQEEYYDMYITVSLRKDVCFNEENVVNTIGICYVCVSVVVVVVVVV